jgi:trimeric autotransporter adhesin
MKKQLFIVVATFIVAVYFCAPTLQGQTTNTARGFQALFSNTSGTYNTAMGFGALRSNTTGTANSAFGALALYSNTIAGQNTAIGRSALYSNTTGGNNTASGAGALYFNTTGHDNTATGLNAMYNNKTGNSNTAIGSFAMYLNTTGYENWAGGNNALHSNTTGYQNTASGSAALTSNPTGYRNSAFGANALFSNISGVSNTAIGHSALNHNTTGGNNTACGSSALNDNTIGESNTATGSGALRNNSIGYYNTANGAAALFGNSTGSNNTATGYQALFLNNTGIENTAMGSRALFINTRGVNNTAIGADALATNSNGAYNTASGHSALGKNTSGESNTATGTGALYSNTIGGYNTANGVGALELNTTGEQNTVCGVWALRAVSNGSSNSALGFQAGSFSETYQSTFIGAYSDATGPVFNSTALGHEAIVTMPNQVRVGNTAVSSIGGQVGWTTLSDGRYKENVKEDVPGLEFINKLHPITYTLKVSEIDNRLLAGRKKPATGSRGIELPRHEPSAEEQASKAERAKIVYTGFVAQEVEEIAAKLNYNFSGIDAPKSKEDFYGLRYGDFVVPLVKAVQELSAENEQLRNELNELKELVSKMLSGKNIDNEKAIANLSGAYLEQNQPNPFQGSTVIRYNLPEGTSSAKIDITGINGQLLKSIPLTGRGKGQVSLTANSLAKGAYTCTLWVNNQKADSKQMLVK